MDGYVAQKDSLIFALAYCAKQNMSVPLREAAYSAVKKICITSEDLFSFVNYCSKMGEKVSSGMYSSIFIDFMINFCAFIY